MELVLANGFEDPKLGENRGNRSQSCRNLDARSRFGPPHVSGGQRGGNKTEHIRNSRSAASSEMSEGTTVRGNSRSPSPDPVQRNRKAKQSAGNATAKPNFDPRPRTSASASRGLQSITGLTPIPSQDPEDLFESDSESTCSRCSLRGKCPAQDGVCDGQTAEEVD